LNEMLNGVTIYLCGARVALLLLVL